MLSIIKKLAMTALRTDLVGFLVESPCFIIFSLRKSKNNFTFFKRISNVLLT